MFTKYTLKEFSAKSNNRPYDKNRAHKALTIGYHLLYHLVWMQFVKCKSTKINVIDILGRKAIYLITNGPQRTTQHLRLFSIGLKTATEPILVLSIGYF